MSNITIKGNFDWQNDAAATAFNNYLECFLTKDMERLFSLFAENSMVHFPYNETLGTPIKLEGIAEISNYYRDSPKYFDFFRYFDVAFYPTADADFIWAEAKCEGRISSSDRPYNQQYFSSLRIQDGKIVEYREVFNPATVLDAFGGKEAMFRAFSMNKE